ncbi:hypothetical protein [Sulfitobacter mediterraneus]|uniref:Tetratricopeptide repeat protein n=1 Tax=Sulfitobacter mediterraneus TaxID=83219 RepID=A0A2T6C4Z6_9RHOB|nr:hypothetical protein [Sulfitobacter mediterraneus]KIN78169.1 Tetratricopeptide repeat domain protein [Sulfitobacter mediterraneus KCTC 32188]PTX63389.1 hypothetical protein C8N31_11723 [Sulfitobacter mediterraneus]
MAKNKTTRDQLWIAFRNSAWGKTTENDRELRELRNAVDKGILGQGTGQKVLEAMETGKQAFELGSQLGNIFKQRGKNESERWLESVEQQSPDKKIMRHLNKKLADLIDYQNLQRARRPRGSQTSNVRAQLVDGGHPNDLRRQNPALNWTIYIDESGRIFDESASELNDANKDVGRLVALAVPSNVKLSPLDFFHAAEAPSEQIDEILQRLLDAPVGIFGFSVNNRSAQHVDWLGHVLHLVRWVLLQLPVPISEGSCKVQVLIEQRGSDRQSENLLYSSREIESECRALDPARFSGLELTLEFMDKNHSMNGYVDAIANTWGSPNKDRLRKSSLLGHCLVETKESSLHHLFLALRDRGPLAAENWYLLCSAAESDPAQGFLNRELDRLGLKLKQYPHQWTLYLNEVQSRLQRKQYKLSELGHAIGWLQQYSTANQSLPDVLKLQLLSSKLALGNHRGDFDIQIFKECLSLSEGLRDEEPQLACEAVLRMASMSTNFFEFGALKDSLKGWLAQPVAVAGLRNYGKLLSTLGQLEAFEGQADEALGHFDQALEYFSRLSDGSQAQIEVLQTSRYRLVAEMDSVSVLSTDQEASTSVQRFISGLREHLDNAQSERNGERLAQSGQDGRFDQHLWLRSLVSFPRELSEERKEYLSQSALWQVGADHPWPLILAYRAWLFQMENRPDLALSLMKDAIAACEEAEHGPTLEWLSEVLRTLANILGLEMGVDSPSQEQRAYLEKRLPRAPHSALRAFAEENTRSPLSHSNLLKHLGNCLPFNFH